ncbi:MAG: hypothetical protein LBU79_03010 [Planctomycetota bacterium]|jgi:hypothetical protein|nr:hypothetical protein [Planctomycetota bacterium]
MPENNLAVKTTRATLLALLALAIWTTGLSVAPAGEAPRRHMIYFYNPNCRLCTATTEVVARVEDKYQGQMTTERYNIADSERGLDFMEYLFELLDQMDVPEDVSTLLTVFLGVLEEDEEGTVFVPQRVLLEKDGILDHLEEEAAAFIDESGSRLPTGAPGEAALAIIPPFNTTADPPPVYQVDQTNRESAAATSRAAVNAKRSQERAEKRLRLGAVSAAAFADSINPCAFATIIILTSMMASARRTRREIIAVCLSFTAAVYLTYFAIGLSLYQVIAEMNARGGWYLVAADMVYYLAFVLCVLFGILCLLDAILLFLGRRREEMVLKLPQAFKTRINVSMAKGVRAHWLILGVFVAGVSVSFLEAACTGQVYLPTLIIIAGTDFLESLFLIAWYNLIFVLPLLVIFGLVLLGVSSADLAIFFQQNVAWTKLLLALVFLIMGYWVWTEMYWPPGYRG